MSGQSLVKVVVLGDLVGQTQLINRYVNSRFSYDSRRTLYADFHNKVVHFHGEKIQYQIWDVSCNERFKTLYEIYFRDAQGCLLVYNITRDFPFDKNDGYIKEIEKHGRKDVKLILVGNQCDLEEKRIVSKQFGAKIAAKYNLKFFETSAKTGHNVDLVFTSLLEDILSKRTVHVDHVVSQVELDERKQVNFFSKFKKVFSRTKPTNSVNSSNSRSSKENSSVNGREIFTEQLLGDDRESSHQFVGTESVVKEFDPPGSQVLMPGPQVCTLDLNSCSQGTLQEVFNEPEQGNLDCIMSSSKGVGSLSQKYSLDVTPETRRSHSKHLVSSNDEPEQKSLTSNQEEDDGLKLNCAYIEPESRDVIEPEPRDKIEPESGDVIEPESGDVIELESSLFSQTSLSRNHRTPTEDVDDSEYECLLNIPNIITDKS